MINILYTVVFLFILPSSLQINYVGSSRELDEVPFHDIHMEGDNHTKHFSMHNVILLHVKQAKTKWVDFILALASENGTNHAVSPRHEMIVTDESIYTRRFTPAEGMTDWVQIFKSDAESGSFYADHNDILIGIEIDSFHYVLWINHRKIKQFDRNAKEYDAFRVLTNIYYKGDVDSITATELRSLPFSPIVSPYVSQINPHNSIWVENDGDNWWHLSGHFYETTKTFKIDILRRAVPDKTDLGPSLLHIIFDFEKDFIIVDHQNEKKEWQKSDTHKGNPLAKDRYFFMQMNNKKDHIEMHIFPNPGSTKYFAIKHRKQVGEDYGLYRLEGIVHIDEPRYGYFDAEFVMDKTAEEIKIGKISRKKR